MSKRLQGKVSLITGGSDGIGLATAKQFAEEGAHVYITGRRQAQLDAAVSAIGSNVTAIQGDVTKPTDLDRTFAQIKKEKGRLDILFANAGGSPLVPLGSITEEHFDTVFNLKVKGLRRHRSHRLHRRYQRLSVLQYLLGSKGGGTQLRPDLDDRPQGPWHSSERHQSGPDRYSASQRGFLKS